MLTPHFLNDHIILENERVRLEPLEEIHFDTLSTIAQQKELWTFTSAKISSDADFRRYFDTALEERKNGSSYPFAVYDKLHQRYGGCTRFSNISILNKRLEIGWTWYDPSLQRSGLNRNCKFLLLTFGFEQLFLNRIELKTSLFNKRSQKAMEDIGAVKEGILRKHSVNEDGSVRDTVYYSFINDDWNAIKAAIFKDYK